MHPLPQFKGKSIKQLQQAGDRAADKMVALKKQLDATLEEFNLVQAEIDWRVANA